MFHTEDEHKNWDIDGADLFPTV